MMINIYKKRTITLSIISICMLVVVSLIALLVGRFNVSPSVLIELIKGNASDYPVEYSIIMNLRLPRTMMALLVGMGLSLSGLVYQKTFRNKLVSPDFLGVSSGASVGAALAIILGLGTFFVSSWAFIGGIIAMVSTIAISKLMKNVSPTIMILSGIIVSSLLSSILSFIKYSAPSDTVLADITFWLMGSFATTSYIEVLYAAIVIGVGTMFLFMIKWRINIVGQGPYEAKTQGLNYSFYYLAIIITSTLMTAISVSFVGIIGWVGLIIPHLVRIIIGENTSYSIPLTALFGAIFMIISDVLSRTFTGSEIPISAVTGAIGALVFIIILYFRRRTVNEPS